MYKAEYLASNESGNVGRTVYFKDVGRKRREADFRPGSSLDGKDEISYYVDANRRSDLSVSSTTVAIDGAMNSWNEVECSTLGIHKISGETQTGTGYIGVQ